MSKKLVELKPCPFCGGKAERYDNEYRDLYIIKCSNPKCKLFVETYKFDRRCDATKAWNRRADNE